MLYQILCQSHSSEAHTYISRCTLLPVCFVFKIFAINNIFLSSCNHYPCWIRKLKKISAMFLNLETLPKLETVSEFWNFPKCYKKEFGFQKSLSCVHALTNLLKNIEKAIRYKLIVSVIYIYLQTSHYTVYPDTLFYKSIIEGTKSLRR